MKQNARTISIQKYMVASLCLQNIAISKLQGCLLNCDFSSVTRTIDVEEKDKTTKKSKRNPLPLAELQKVSICLIQIKIFKPLQFYTSA